jgi:hypothetical protein
MVMLDSARRKATVPAVALVGSYELLMLVIRGSQPAPGGMSSSADNPDPLGEQAAEIFADQLAADRVPSVRAIRAQLHVGQPRGQRLRDYLAAGAASRAWTAKYPPFCTATRPTTLIG